MKKTGKKLSIRKETVNSFATLSNKEMQEAKGGGSDSMVTLCLGCFNSMFYFNCNITKQY